MTRKYKIDYEGIANFILHQYQEADSMNIKRWAGEFMDQERCSECQGARLNLEALNFKIDEIYRGFSPDGSQ